VTVQDGGRTPLSTSGQLTVIIDNYDVTAAAKWRSVATRSESSFSFLSLPLGSIYLAIIFAITTATVLLAVLLAVAFVVVHRKRNGKYVVNGPAETGSGNVGLQVEGDTGNSMAMQPLPARMLVVDDVTTYDDVICCDDNCSDYSDVIQVRLNSTVSLTVLICLCRIFESV